MRVRTEEKIIDVLRRSKSSWITTTALAERTGISRAVIARKLTAMEELGVVEMQESHESHTHEWKLKGVPVAKIIVERRVSVSEDVKRQVFAAVQEAPHAAAADIVDKVGHSITCIYDALSELVKQRFVEKVPARDPGVRNGEKYVYRSLR